MGGKGQATGDQSKAAEKGKENAVWLHRA